MSQLYVHTQGSGPPLVLLHGWAMHGGVFATLAQRLYTGRTLYLVDLPGHGLSADSPVPLQLDATVQAVLAQVPDAPWCAWSMGGLFALHAAATRPRRVPGLVMIGASPRFVRGEDWAYGVSPEIFQEFARSLEQDYRATLDRFVALEAFSNERARQAVRAMQAQLFARGQPPASTLAQGLRLLETSDLRDELARLRVPSLWLGGRRDRLVDPRAMRQAAGMAPQARFVQIEHGGHAPFLTDTDEVATLIRTFLDEHNL